MSLKMQTIIVALTIANFVFIYFAIIHKQIKAPEPTTNPDTGNLMACIMPPINASIITHKAVVISEAG
jgi:hypothetical protein